MDDYNTYESYRSDYKNFFGQDPSELGGLDGDYHGRDLGYGKKRKGSSGKKSGKSGKRGKKALNLKLKKAFTRKVLSEMKKRKMI